jgi:hypothetical protein
MVEKCKRQWRKKRASGLLRALQPRQRSLVGHLPAVGPPIRQMPSCVIIQEKGSISRRRASSNWELSFICEWSATRPCRHPQPVKRSHDPFAWQRSNGSRIWLAIMPFVLAWGCDISTKRRSLIVFDVNTHHNPHIDVHGLPVPSQFAA